VRGSSIPTELLSKDNGFKTMISESRYIPPYLDNTTKEKQTKSEIAHITNNAVYSNPLLDDQISASKKL
jgi:hypothetical protein